MSWADLSHGNISPAITIPTFRLMALDLLTSVPLPGRLLKSNARLVKVDFSLASFFWPYLLKKINESVSLPARNGDCIDNSPGQQVSDLETSIQEEGELTVVVLLRNVRLLYLHISLMYATAIYRSNDTTEIYGNPLTKRVSVDKDKNKQNATEYCSQAE
ncbi:hypothetical protein C8R44DRAFT_734939 [Mycena epipterygia]|nr:hypothetical protein C8R44DRAFT_734939 [Mycena epipterygia]